MKGSKLLSDINVALNSKWKYENTNFCDNLINPYRNLIVTELTTDEQYDSFRKILLSIKCYKDINFLKNETLRLFSQLKSYHAYEFLRTTEKIIDLNNNASYTLFEAAKLLDDFCNKQVIDRKDVSIGASFMIDLDHSIKKDCDNKLYEESLSETKKRENIIEIEKYFKNISIIHFGTSDYCFFETAKAKNTFKTFIKECVDKYNSINEIDKADFNDILNLIDCCGEYIEIDSFFLGKISDELKKADLWYNINSKNNFLFVQRRFSTNVDEEWYDNEFLEIN